MVCDCQENANDRLKKPHNDKKLIDWLKKATNIDHATKQIKTEVTSLV